MKKEREMRKGFEERLTGKSFQLMLWQEKPEKPKMTFQTSEKNLDVLVGIEMLFILNWIENISKILC